MDKRDERDDASESACPLPPGDGSGAVSWALTGGRDASGGGRDATSAGLREDDREADANDFASGADDPAADTGDPAAGTGDPAACTDDSAAGTDDSADAVDCAPDEDGRRLPEDDDFDADAEMARWVADLESGRERIPEEWESEGPAVSISLGDAADVDPALLAAMAGPDGLGGESLSPLFGQDQSADALRPGPLLAALAEQAVSDIAALTDDQLFGALHAARRIENRAVYLQTVAVAEFARRRAAQREDARARKVPRGRRPGEFPADELASELVSTAHYAGAQIEGGLALTSRLPRTLAGMAAGLIDGWRAGIITAWTASLTDADAGYADEILAAVAPSLRPDQLSRKAAALELKLNPEGVKARREHAKATRQRVEVRREDSGNACLAGRELDTVDALASKAYIDALAVRIRNSGLVEGTLSSIRVRVMIELLQGRNPLHLMRPRPKVGLACDPPPADIPPADAPTPAAGAGAGDGAGLWDPDDPGPDFPDDTDDFSDLEDPDDHDGPGDPGPDYAGPDGALAWSSDEAANARYDTPDNDPGARRGPLRPGETAPPPATLNLIIPIGTLLGWSTAPPPPAASASSTPTKPAPSPKPRPAIPEPAGPSPSSTRQGRPSPTAAPAASTPGTRQQRRPEQHLPEHHRREQRHRRHRQHRHRHPHRRTAATAPPPSSTPGSAT